MEGFVQLRAGVAALEREVVGFLELAEDFGFTQNHRVQPAGDAEEVVQTLGFGVRVKHVAGRLGLGVEAGEEFAEAGGGNVGVQRGGGVKLDAVAGGKDDAFVGEAGFAELLQGDGNAGFGEGEALAHFDRRGAVAQADDDKRHAQGTRVEAAGAVTAGGGL